MNFVAAQVCNLDAVCLGAGYALFLILLCIHAAPRTDLFFLMIINSYMSNIIWELLQLHACAIKGLYWCNKRAVIIWDSEGFAWGNGNKKF